MKWTLFLLLVVGAVVLAAAQDLEEDNELFAEDQQDEASTAEDNSSTEEDEDDQVNLRVVRSAAAQSEGTGRVRNRGAARGNAEQQQQGDRRRRGEGKGIHSRTQLLYRTSLSFLLIEPSWQRSFFFFFFLSCIDYLIESIVIFISVHVLMQLPACRYTKGAWSECNTATNQRSRSLTLKKGDSSCEQSKTITKKCKKGQSPFIDSFIIVVRHIHLRRFRGAALFPSVNNEKVLLLFPPASALISFLFSLGISS